MSFSLRLEEAGNIYIFWVFFFFFHRENKSRNSLERALTILYILCILLVRNLNAKERERWETQCLILVSLLWPWKTYYTPGNKYKENWQDSLSFSIDLNCGFFCLDSSRNEDLQISYINLSSLVYAYQSIELTICNNFWFETLISLIFVFMLFRNMGPFLYTGGLYFPCVNLWTVVEIYPGKK